MDTVYRTYDGKIFDNYNEAVQHEALLDKSVEMYTRRGERTTNIDDAYVIHLEWNSYVDRDTCAAAKRFMDLAHEQDADTNGIEEDSCGWYYWDEGNDWYRWVDEDVVGAFWRIKSEHIK